MGMTLRAAERLQMLPSKKCPVRSTSCEDGGHEPSIAADRPLTHARISLMCALAMRSARLCGGSKARSNGADMISLQNAWRKTARCRLCGWQSRRNRLRRSSSAAQVSVVWRAAAALAVLAAVGSRSGSVCSR